MSRRRSTTHIEAIATTIFRTTVAVLRPTGRATSLGLNTSSSRYAVVIDHHPRFWTKGHVKPHFRRQFAAESMATSNNRQRSVWRRNYSSSYTFASAETGGYVGLYACTIGIQRAPVRACACALAGAREVTWRTTLEWRRRHVKCNFGNNGHSQCHNETRCTHSRYTFIYACSLYLLQRCHNFTYRWHFSFQLYLSKRQLSYAVSTNQTLCVQTPVYQCSFS